MKFRFGFVTNSSSSSFIISKKHLTSIQIEQINNYLKVAEFIVHRTEDDWEPNRFGWLNEDWDIEENNEYISGSSWTDNFDMYAFLDYIRVPEEKVHWYDSSHNLAYMIEKQEEE